MTAYSKKKKTANVSKEKTTTIKSESGNLGASSIVNGDAFDSFGFAVADMLSKTLNSLFNESNTKNKAKCSTEKACSGKSKDGIVANWDANRSRFDPGAVSQKEKDNSYEEDLIQAMSNLYVSENLNLK